MEHVVLGFGTAGEKLLEVSVDLRSHDEGDLGIPEVAEHARGEVR